MNIPTPNPGLTTIGIMEALRASGKPLREWGKAVDGTPLLAARAGGNKQPAIFITAGAHCTETAGVHSALNLLSALDTEHEVHVLPLRDPFGFAGVEHCLSIAAGRPAGVTSHAGALGYLQTHGRLLWEENGMYVFKLGDIGFVWQSPGRPSVGRWIAVHSRMLLLSKESPDVLSPLRGKSVMVINAMPDVEGAGETGRCLQGVISIAGEWMHLNRFFGRDDAPSEVAAVDRLMRTVRPGLTCDLHEGNGAGFWMPIARPEKNPERVFDMTKAYFDYIHARGYPVTTIEEWAATDETTGKNYDPNWMLPEPRLPGLFWCNGLLRNEGYNLSDYAGLFGIGYGTEAPMERPLAMRVDGITNGMLAAIRVWEKRT
jgi:hypothetical protein